MIKRILISLLLCATSALHAANYLTFTAEADSSSFGIKNEKDNNSGDTPHKSDAPDVQYSLNSGETWTALAANTTIQLKKRGDKALLRGVNPQGFSQTHTHFVMKGRIAASGNVMSLIDGKGETNIIPTAHCFYLLFSGCESLTEAPELPATELKAACYKWMFENCTNLRKAPQLPAKKLYKSCYNRMFRNCTSLTHVPDLSATELAEYCCIGMFSGCTSLTQAPQLPAKKLSLNCYIEMFSGCTSLTQAPKLPATELDNACYLGMFRECTSLTQAPQLPATKLEEGCYYRMFENCTSLTQAPQLPATTLQSCCYTGMFRGCTSLKKAPRLPAKKMVVGCYDEMFRECTSLSEISVGFTEWNSNNDDTRSCREWLDDVAPNGTFFYPKALDLDSDDAQIPMGWKTMEN